MLTYNEFKKWNVECNKTFYEKMGPIFEQEPFRDKRANRIYLYSKIENDYKLQPEIKEFLLANGFAIYNEIEGTCLEITTDVRTKKSPIKIGKVLNKLSPELLKEFTNKKTLHVSDTDDCVTVISRHPYDIIGISTRRRWTLCTDLHEKVYNGAHLVGKFKDLLNNGSLVAYLVNKEDKNINDPISRINFTVYKSNPDSIFKYESHGKYTPSFEKIAADWITKANNILASTSSVKTV